jgi:hypothetical protein
VPDRLRRVYRDAPPIATAAAERLDWRTYAQVPRQPAPVYERSARTTQRSSCPWTIRAFASPTIYAHRKSHAILVWRH